MRSDQPNPKSRPLRPRPGAVLGLKLGLGVAAIGLVLVVFVFPPEQHPFYPRCLFFSLTGWQCPGCGGLRALHHLLHGHFRTAFALHPLLVAGLPLVLLAAGRCWWTYQTTGRWAVPPQSSLWIWLIVAGIVLFSIGRNLLPPML